MRFEVTTQASPAQVREALTDFTDRRTRIWSRTLDPKGYEVREVGDTWAVARENTAGSPFWVVSRYDWSDPSVVRTVVVEGSWGGGGIGEFRISPLDGGGSRVHAYWTHTGVTRRWERILLRLLESRPVRRMIARTWVKALDGFARSCEPDSGPDDQVPPVRTRPRD
ncbi:hypothetical protein [Nocardioides caldifontis]|uniref:hypothetical protein n=1 Tax=Nocardioides caldifontis TaxID=2588938 RepID=UPI0011DFFA16|nr:hypothetical protein [Nocardioides caldifontis]